VSEKPPAPERPPDWWTRPKVVLPTVGAIALLVALLTPEPSVGRLGDARLSSHLTGSLGAGALSRTAARFGFTVSARDTLAAPDSTQPAGVTIHAVLAPPLPIAPAEAHRYLERVRAGDALLFVLGNRNALADSLGVSTTRSGAVLHVAPSDSADCGRSRDFMPPLWPDGRAHLLGVRWTRGTPGERVTFALRADPTDADAARFAEAATGIPLGRGRVVVVADPDLLRNDVLRHCQWGADVIAMRMLEWLRAGGDRPRSALVFDEYHQGYGHTASLSGVVGGFLVGHPVGRALLMLVGAGLILLLATGPRALPPIDRETIERRDPLEQVDALAHAYEQVGATRTVTARLLHALRQRVEGSGGAYRMRTDEIFLADAERMDSTLRADVALITRALRETLAERDLPEVAAALRRIEDSLTTTHA
jgi:hypothetical protein